MIMFEKEKPLFVLRVFEDVTDEKQDVVGKSYES